MTNLTLQQAVDKIKSLEQEIEELKIESDFSKVETRGLYELKTKLSQENNQLKERVEKLENVGLIVDTTVISGRYYFKLKQLKQEIVDLIRNENVTDGNYELWEKLQQLLKDSTQ